MAVFVKEVLVPGDKNGVKVTPEDCRNMLAGISDVHNAGLFIPVVLEHPPIDRDAKSEGWPMVKALSDAGRQSANALKATVGNTIPSHPLNRINERGGLDLAFEVPDESEAERFRNGTYRFVSPELRKRWNGFDNLATHLAVTHRPRQRHQE